MKQFKKAGASTQTPTSAGFSGNKRLHPSPASRPSAPPTSSRSKLPRPEDETPDALTDIRPFLNMMPAIRQSPERSVRLAYDDAADVLYVHFKEPEKPRTASWPRMT